MNIIDSSCWIEYLMNSSIGTDIAPIIENPEELMVPTITMYEVYKKLSTEKGVDYAMTIISYMQSGTVVELDSNLSVLAAQISLKYKLPMADSIIYATTINYSATLFTADQHFKDLSDVRYYPKLELRGIEPLTS